ncbi:hypothetical protein ROZALSC1DRAFT_28801, partial [Rozella allomycis CSF55]
TYSCNLAKDFDEYKQRVKKIDDSIKNASSRDFEESIKRKQAELYQTLQKIFQRYEKKISQIEKAFSRLESDINSLDHKKTRIESLTEENEKLKKSIEYEKEEKERVLLKCNEMQEIMYQKADENDLLNQKILKLNSEIRHLHDLIRDNGAAKPMSADKFGNLGMNHFEENFGIISPPKYTPELNPDTQYTKVLKSLPKNNVNQRLKFINNEIQRVEEELILSIKE